MFLDGVYLGVLNRINPQQMEISVQNEFAQLDILVENMGRVNYGSAMQWEYKGITKGVKLETQLQFNWTHFVLPMNNLTGLKYQSGSRKDLPGFFRGTLELLADPLDTFVMT